MRSLFNVPAHADRTSYRRSRALNILTILTSGMVGLLALIIVLTTHDLRILLFALISYLIFGAPYLINRTGRVDLAVNVFLAGNILVILASGLINRTAVPGVFFMGITVVIAGAFGRPRTPLLWAAALTVVPFLINVLLYGSLIAPMAPVTTPEGFTMQPIWRLELVSLGLLWILAGLSSLTTWLLGAAVSDSRAAAETAMEAQQALKAQQADLAQRNAELLQVQQRLETLVTALAIPVVPLTHAVGLLPLTGPVDAARMQTIEQTTLATTTAQRFHALVIDLSGATNLDATSAAALVRLCATLRLLGVTTLLAGLGAAGAMLLSISNLQLPPTVATVEDALRILDQTNHQIFGNA
jgi:anti-anti-sigma regulatory factor